MFDMITMNNEVNEAFASSYDMPDVDESELEAELAALGNELDLGETDTSYMNEALRAPVVPENPNMPLTEKVCSLCFTINFQFRMLKASRWTNSVCQKSPTPSSTSLPPPSHFLPVYL